LNVKTVSIIGGGPAGLFAAEILSGAGIKVDLYDRKPSVGRKFLLAGRGGLNLTHSEDSQDFIDRYEGARPHLGPMIAQFTPQDLRNWADSLGAQTFVGSSGRVFPKAFKASPLLRAWLLRLQGQGVRFHLQHEWQGWDSNRLLLFSTPAGMAKQKGDAVLLALGGASWPSLGSDASWTKYLPDIEIAPFRAANSGFTCDWTPVFREKFSGQPLKNIIVRHAERSAQGDAMIDIKGLEGGVIYALARFLRESIEENGYADVSIDLRPDLSKEKIMERLSRGQGRQSFTTFMQKSLSLSAPTIGLMRESFRDIQTMPYERLANLIKSLPLRFNAPFPLERAISSAGGIKFSELDEHLMLKKLPGIFCAGEMLDWEAPTGGYLLQACFATGRRAAKGILEHLQT
jgi:uncharacterized flavoprotein (TIGR03862 family)